MRVFVFPGTTWRYSQPMRKGRVMLSTWKSAQSKRLPDCHFFPLNKVRESVVCNVQPPASITPSYSGFYDGQETLRYDSGHTPSPTRLEQTIFIILASLAGLAFLVVISLLLCKFQCQVCWQSGIDKTLDCSLILQVWSGQTILIQRQSWI